MKKPIPYSQIFRHYFEAMKEYPVSGIGVFLAYAGGFILADVVVQLFYRDLFDLVATSTPSSEAWKGATEILIRIGLIYLVFNAFFRLADYLIVYHQGNVLRELENRAFEGLLRHSYGFFANSFTGGLIAKAKRFATSFERIHDEITFQLWPNIVLILGVIVTMLFTLKWLALFLIAWLILYTVGTYFFIQFRKKYDLVEAEQDSNVNSILSDVVTNIINLKLFTSSGREKISFRNSTNKQYEARSKMWNLNNIYIGLTALAVGILEVGGTIIAVYFWMKGVVTAGTVVLTQLYFLKVSSRIWRIGKSLGNIFKGLSDAYEMVEILDQPIEVKDAKKTEKARIGKGKITFKKVGFAYKNGEKIFEELSLNIPAGQKVGLVGASGAGKSSLFRLLLRFADVQRGSIEIDAQDIRKISQDDLRRAISFVPQDPILFHRTLFENIAYGNPDASEKEVIQAAKWAHAHDFIERLPKKYETLVGERGIKLSGGERQRVAIARAFLKKAPILLLDEATSSLDSVSEKYIQENLKKLMEGKTTLAIAHRISTIQQMDRILVMQDGKMEEDGTHEELLKKKGVYSRLWSHQSNGFLLDDSVE